MAVAVVAGGVVWHLSGDVGLALAATNLVWSLLEPRTNSSEFRSLTPRLDSAMHISGVPFHAAGAIEAERDPTGALVLDYPHYRFANPRQLRLNKYGAGPFLRLRVAPLPQVPGVYAVLDESGDVLYIGRAKDSLSARWGRRGYAVIDPRNCFVGGQSTNCRINGLIYQYLDAGKRLTLWVYQIPDPVALEDRLIRELRPPWNLR